jgi:hypothetical protein
MQLLEALFLICQITYLLQNAVLLNDLSSCASMYLEGTVYQPCAEELAVSKNVICSISYIVLDGGENIYIYIYFFLNIQCLKLKKRT